MCGAEQTFVSIPMTFRNALIFAIIIYLLGILIGIFSPNKEAAFNGMRVEYFGAVFMGSFVLFFVANYCKVKIHALIKSAMLLIATSILILLWTTESHRLIYKSYEYSELPLVGLVAESGILRPAHGIFSLLCTAASCVIIINRLITWDVKYRKRLSLFLISMVIPAIANILQGNVYFFVENGVNIAALSMIFFIIMLWFAVVKLDLLDTKAETQAQFYKRMAHELLTPLTKISTKVQMANRHPEEASELLRKAQDEIMDMADLINTALDESEGRNL